MYKIETVPLMLDVTAHTHVMGRPSGAWVYDEIMAKATSDLWLCTREEMANCVLASTLNSLMPRNKQKEN
jgi:hypothetical protein